MLVKNYSNEADGTLYKCLFIFDVTKEETIKKRKLFQENMSTLLFHEDEIWEWQHMQFFLIFTISTKLDVGLYFCFLVVFCF